MSASKIIRNSGGDKTITYGGRDWAFPGNGDTTMVPGDVADHVEQFHSRDGLLIVHPEVEAAERERRATIEAQAAEARAKEEALVAELGQRCEGPPVDEDDDDSGIAPCPNRTKNASGLCDDCEALEKGEAPPDEPKTDAPPDPPVVTKPAKPAKKAAGKKKG
jgi:hypothetical protein